MNEHQVDGGAPLPPRGKSRLPFFRPIAIGAFALSGGVLVTIGALFFVWYLLMYEACNVARVPVYGVITALPTDVAHISSDQVVAAIEYADTDPSIEAILLDVNSYGGSPVAGEEIAHALERATKPTVSLIRDAGTSAAYWAAIGAKQVIASANSDVGSIGVTMSYVDEATKNKQEGLQYNELSSGKYKNMGDPNKPLSPEEHDLAMRDIMIVHSNFVDEVARLRHLPMEKVAALADGSGMTGAPARDAGLIDAIGDLHAAREYLKEMIGKDAVVCSTSL
jgi:protease-4